MRPLRTYSLDPRTIEALGVLSQDSGYKICRIIDMLVREKVLHCQDNKIGSYEKMSAIMEKPLRGYSKSSLRKKKS